MQTGPPVADSLPQRATAQGVASRDVVAAAAEETAARAAPGPLPPGRRSSPVMHRLNFPSIPEERTALVDLPGPGRRGAATATRPNNIMGLPQPEPGGGAAAAAVAAWLPPPHLLHHSPPGDTDGQPQLQALLAPPAGARPSPVTADSLDVLRGMVDDPVARSCANALLRAYAHGPTSETLQRAVSLLATMQRCGPQFFAAAPLAAAASSSAVLDLLSRRRLISHSQVLHRNTHVWRMV